LNLRTLNFCLAIAVLGVWFVFLRPAFLGGPVDYVIVSGQSMEPKYQDGDFVVTRRGEYQPGDVIAFHPDGMAGSVIHRIVGGNAQDGFVTRGDNRDTVDEWRPRGSQISGEAWVHIPAAGKWLGRVREPAIFAALIGLIGFFVVVTRRTRKRTHKEGMVMNPKQPAAAQFSLSPLWVVAGFTVVLTAVSALLAVYAFTRPTSETVRVGRPRYTQTTAFDYTILTDPSILYPEGRVGPVGGDGGMKPEELPPIYTKPVNALDVGFNYQLDSAPAAEVSGTYSASVVVSAADDGWSRPQPLIPQTPFQGPAFGGRARIDLAPIQAMVDAVEKETGVSSNYYLVTLLLDITAKTTLDTEPASVTQAPALAFRVSRSRLTPPAALSVKDEENRSQTVTTKAEIGAAGLSLPVTRARGVALAGAAAGLVLSGGLAVAIQTGFGQGEASRVSMRYGALVVPVTQVEDRNGRRVQVATLSDLGRLAQRNSGVIFAQGKPGQTRYFITDGATTYEYSSGPAPRRVRVAVEAERTALPREVSDRRAVGG
jgi:signal peptidase I